MTSEVPAGLTSTKLKIGETEVSVVTSDTKSGKNDYDVSLITPTRIYFFREAEPENEVLKKMKETGAFGPGSEIFWLNVLNTLRYEARLDDEVNPSQNNRMIIEMAGRVDGRDLKATVIVISARLPGIENGKPGGIVGE